MIGKRKENIGNGAYLELFARYIWYIQIVVNKQFPKGGKYSKTNQLELKIAKELFC